MQSYLNVGADELASIFGDYNDSNNYNYSEYNNGDEAHTKPCYSTRWVSLGFKFWFLIFVLCCACIGNIWLLFQIFRSRFYRICHVLLCALCCNALVGCAYILFHMLEVFASVLSSWFCKIEALLQGFYMLFGILIICCMCFDTWVAIWFPSFKSREPVLTGFKCCVVIAALAAIMSVPKVLYVGVLRVSTVSTSSKTPPHNGQCYVMKGLETSQLLRVFNITSSVTGFLLPLLFLLLFYGMCLYKLLHSKFKARIAAMRTMICIIFFFLLFYGPMYCVMMYDTLMRLGYVPDTCTSRTWIDLLKSCLECFSTMFIVIIPIINACFSSQLRQKLLRSPTISL
ncbi:ORF74 [Felid gammaherpesvirus 1]|uniref:ORF74 n=1 Tax=Felid gammaherpesvirus 1 TaxID=2560468 RepID=A0A0M4MPX9_9GAMA|nr:ORF74 [Felis catus gammaherpesvirus 1]ALE14790.1 ORF74 [Felis catus gammaherpesvirus 1]